MIIQRGLSITAALCGTLFSASILAAPVSGQGTWESTLLARDLDGNLGTAEAYYDTVLDITWLADANIAGEMTWADAKTWAAGLDPYGSGVTGWRLPTVIDNGNDGCNWSYSGTDCGYNVDTATSEMASLFYDTLGNLGYYDTSGSRPQVGWGLPNTGPFSNVHYMDYWSATESVPSYLGWTFNFNYGEQYHEPKNYIRYAWAVHSGDVGTAVVPLPAAFWLFCSGLLGLLGTSRFRKCKSR